MNKRFKVKIKLWDFDTKKFCIMYSFGYFTFWRYLKSYRYSNGSILTMDIDCIKTMAKKMESIQDVRLWHETVKKSAKERSKTILVLDKEVL